MQFGRQMATDHDFRRRLAPRSVQSSRRRPSWSFARQLARLPCRTRPMLRLTSQGRALPR